MEGFHMINAGDFRKGVTIEWEGGVWSIVDFQHVKPGKTVPPFTVRDV